MSDQHIPGRVENYTRPFLIMSGIILFMGFWTIAALAGSVAVLVTTILIEVCLRVLRSLIGHG